jgi:CubicO group peptidase (beta-lactamase class C family)
MTHPVGFIYRIEPPLAPAGDASMSIEDFARFAAFHLAGLRGTPTRGIDLPREAFERLHAVGGGEDAGKDYACGWAMIRSPDTTVHWHNGSAGTFFAMMAIDPKTDRGAVVLTSAGTGESAAKEVIKALLSGDGDTR